MAFPLPGSSSVSLTTDVVGSKPSVDCLGHAIRGSLRTLGEINWPRAQQETAATARCSLHGYSTIELILLHQTFKSNTVDCD